MQGTQGERVSLAFRFVCDFSFFRCLSPAIPDMRNAFASMVLLDGVALMAQSLCVFEFF